jgi:hypothetical protein
MELERVIVDLVMLGVRLMFQEEPVSYEQLELADLLSYLDSDAMTAAIDVLAIVASIGLMGTAIRELRSKLITRRLSSITKPRHYSARARRLKSPPEDISRPRLH